MCSFIARNVPAHLVAVGWCHSSIFSTILREKLTDYSVILWIWGGSLVIYHQLANRKMVGRQCYFSFMISVDASIDLRVNLIFIYVSKTHLGEAKSSCQIKRLWYQFGSTNKLLNRETI